jgi:tetratricopeptide (TPR) repeat protein
MIGFIIRCVLALGTLGATFMLFYHGYWGWGITMILPLVIIGFSFFRNENMILALNQMRMGNTDKAKKYINRISHPQFLPKSQHAYVLFLQAVLGTQEIGIQRAEQLLRKAISMGLRTGQDNAVARMHLAGICAQSGRKKEAVQLLSEAKKLDSSGMMKDQINQMQAQLRIAPSKNQMRMAQMMGGRQKTPRRR